MRTAFDESFPDAASLFAGRRLDLVTAARAELQRGGIEGERLSVIELCTHCRPDLASYRREGTGRGTNLAAIALV